MPMRIALVVIATVFAVLVGGASATPKADVLLDTLVIPYGATGWTPSKVDFDPGITYRYVVSGTGKRTHDVITGDCRSAPSGQPCVYAEDAFYCHDSAYDRRCPRLTQNLVARPLGCTACSRILAFPPLPRYGASHEYTFTRKDSGKDIRLEFGSFAGQDSRCDDAGVTCSGEYTIRIYGPAEMESKQQSVKFLFTQAGAPKGSEIIRDMRTIGTGSVTFVNDEPDNASKVGFREIVKSSARIVREFDVVATRRLTLRLKQPVERIVLYQAEAKDPTQSLRLDLEVVSSSDPDCPATLGGKPRPARIVLADGAGRRGDVVALVVTGCPHHNGVFDGSVGPRSRVNVSIVHKRNLPERRIASCSRRPAPSVTTAAGCT